MVAAVQGLRDRVRWVATPTRRLQFDVLERTGRARSGIRRRERRQPKVWKLMAQSLGLLAFDLPKRCLLGFLSQSFDCRGVKFPFRAPRCSFDRGSKRDTREH